MGKLALPYLFAMRFLGLFENNGTVLVFAHPAWPWRMVGRDRRRRDAYMAVLQTVWQSPEPLFLVGSTEAPDGPWSDDLAQLQRKAAGQCPSGEETEFKREAMAVVKFAAGRPIRLGGFYRNLCVAQLAQQLRHLGANVAVDRSISPARLIY